MHLVTRHYTSVSFIQSCLQICSAGASRPKLFCVSEKYNQDYTQCHYLPLFTQAVIFRASKSRGTCFAYNMLFTSQVTADAEERGWSGMGRITRARRQQPSGKSLWRTTEFSRPATSQNRQNVQSLFPQLKYVNFYLFAREAYYKTRALCLTITPFVWVALWRARALKLAVLLVVVFAIHLGLKPQAKFWSLVFGFCFTIMKHQKEVRFLICVFKGSAKQENGLLSTSLTHVPV